MRKTKQTRTATNNRTQTEAGSQLDVWLHRCGNLSQILLGFFTIAGFFFIVIPIYQKELLSESIAKSELRLREVNMEIERIKTAERIRDVKINLLVLHDRCSKYFQNLLYHGQKNDNPTTYELDSRSVLEFNAEECWVNNYREIMKEVGLTDSELQRLDYGINVAAKEIKIKRQKFMAEYDSYQLSENETNSIESEPYDIPEQMAIRAGVKKNDILVGRRNLAHFRAKNSINEKYNSFLRSQAMSLRDNWGSIDNE